MGWTQDEAIAFECARECISDMIAMRTELMYEEKAKPSPNVEYIATLERESTTLWRERAALSVSSHADIARIRTVYGAQIRADHQRRRQERASDPMCDTPKSD